jgi:hypothetical protein
VVSREAGSQLSHSVRRMRSFLCVPQYEWWFCQSKWSSSKTKSYSISLSNPVPRLAERLFVELSSPISLSDGFHSFCQLGLHLQVVVQVQLPRCFSSGHGRIRRRTLYIDSVVFSFSGGTGGVHQPIGPPRINTLYSVRRRNWADTTKSKSQAHSLPSIAAPESLALRLQWTRPSFMCSVVFWCTFAPPPWTLIAGGIVLF